MIPAKNKKNIDTSCKPKSETDVGNWNLFFKTYDRMSLREIR